MSEPNLSTYGSYLRAPGYDGMLVDQNPANIESLMNDQAVPIQFGCAVARSAADNTCKAPAADADVIIGLAARHAIMPTSGPSVGGTNLVQYNQYAEVPVVREGWIYKTPAEAVSKGDQVLSLTAQNGALGGTTSGAAGAGRIVVPNATWEQSGNAAGVALAIRIHN
jgi:hypothetical protein